MARIQFYPNQALESKLTEEAKQLEVSVSALVVDLLTQHYFPLPAHKLSFSQVKKAVFDEVVDYLNDSDSEKEFTLDSASETFRGIAMVYDGRPQTTRARIGKEFARLVGAEEPFLNVSAVYKQNGDVKKGVNNATVYQKITN